MFWSVLFVAVLDSYTEIKSCTVSWKKNRINTFSLNLRYKKLSICFEKKNNTELECEDEAVNEIVDKGEKGLFWNCGATLYGGLQKGMTLRHISCSEEC